MALPNNFINVLCLSHTGHLDASNVGNPDSGQVPANEFRRSFNLGSMRIAELKPARDPFFTMASKFRSEPTDDPEFKRLEKRDIWHRRYAFAVSRAVEGLTASNCLQPIDPDGGGGAQTATPLMLTNTSDTKVIAVDSLIKLALTTDYDVKKGNISPTKYNHLGTLSANSYFGTSNATPNFFYVGQTVQIPVSYVATDDLVVEDVGYLNCIITAVGTAVNDYAVVTFKVLTMNSSWVAGLAQTDNTGYFLTYGIGVPGQAYTTTTGNAFVTARNLNLSMTSSTIRKEDRINIIGSSYAEGSGLPDTGYSEKYDDKFGYTQIFKRDLTITNTAKATVLKIRASELANDWEKTMLIHKRDISQAGLWSVKSKTDTTTAASAGNSTTSNVQRTTEGLVDYVLNNGWVFKLDPGATLDDFTDDLAEFYNPEIGNEGSILFHVSTSVFNWFNKIGNASNPSLFNNTFAGANQPFREGISIMGAKKIAGLNITELSTPHGMMRIVRDINLDGKYVKMIGVNYSNVFYRPLKGNGLNRDTSVYMGVKSLEHTGDDFTTDLVQTEAGYDFRLGETFAMWI